MIWFFMTTKRPSPAGGSPRCRAFLCRRITRLAGFQSRKKAKRFNGRPVTGFPSQVIDSSIGRYSRPVRQPVCEPFLRGICPEKRPGFPVTGPHESSPEQRQNQRPLPAVRSFSADFLRAIDIEWSFARHMSAGLASGDLRTASPKCDLPVSVRRKYLHCRMDGQPQFERQPGTPRTCRHGI